MSATTICTTPMCADGKASVEQMLATYQALGSPKTFMAAVAAIKGSYEAMHGWVTDYIPFNPNCCAIRDIGVAADGLTDQMLKSAGQQPIPGGGPATQNPAATLLPDLTWVLLAGGAFVAFQVYREIRR